MALLLCLFTYAGTSLAKEEIGEDLSVEFQLTKYSGKSSDFGYTAKQFYAEAALTGTDDTSAFLLLYEDSAFREVQLGLATQLTDNLQLGVGVGGAEYDESSHLVVSPWLYYDRDRIRAMVLSEFYSDDWRHPYLKGYVQTDVSTKVFVGMYGESELGIGPLVGVRITDEVKLWASVPVFDTGDIKTVIGISFEF